MKNLKWILSAAALLLFAATLAAQQSARILGHRGGRFEFEENTLEAFKASLDAGVRAFETDIHMTRDGELVIMHDFDVARVTGGTGIIENMTAAEIRALRTKQGHKVPFLKDLLELFRKYDGMYVEWELKTSRVDLYPQERLQEYLEKVYKAVCSAKPASSLYVMSSFDARCMRYMRLAHPDAEMMYITSRPCDENTILLCKALDVKRLAANMNKTCRADVQKAHKEGLILNLWPNATMDDILLSRALGADYICTDIPVEAVGQIRDKGLDLRH